MPASIARIPVTRAHPFPPSPYSESTPLQHRRGHTQSCSWACSANRIRESIHVKNNPSGPQRTVWDWRVRQASREQGIAAPRSLAGRLARRNSPSVTLELRGSDRDTSQLRRAAARCSSLVTTLAPSAAPCLLLWPPPPPPPLHSA